MGNSLRQFYAKTLERGGKQQYALKAVAILRAIREREPYFSQKFWNRYFKGFDWEWEPPDNTTA
jgi:hypothetical protein